MICLYLAYVTDMCIIEKSFPAVELQLVKQGKKEEHLFLPHTVHESFILYHHVERCDEI